MEFTFTNVDHKKKPKTKRAFTKTLRYSFAFHGILTEVFANAKLITLKTGEQINNEAKSIIENGKDFETHRSPFMLWDLYGIKCKYDDIEECSKPYISYTFHNKTKCVSISTIEELLTLMEEMKHPLIISHPFFEEEHQYEICVWDGYL